jgi:hypothetical protein
MLRGDASGGDGEGVRERCPSRQPAAVGTVLRSESGQVQTASSNTSRVRRKSPFFAALHRKNHHAGFRWKSIVLSWDAGIGTIGQGLSNSPEVPCTVAIGLRAPSRRGGVARSSIKAEFVPTGSTSITTRARTIAAGAPLK